MARDLRVEIIGDASSYQRALASASASTDKFGSGIGRIARGAAIAAGAAGIGAIAVTLRAGIGEWEQSAKVAAQTEAVIKSTGGTANVTAQQVDALATSMMNKSGIDDEAIKSGENMLLTFTNIHNEVGKGNAIFDRATQAVTDMDTAMTQGNSSAESLAKTSILVGKALNDPVRGMTALSRVGVTFTAQQKEQVKALVESGKTMEAQKLILGELTKEFGGSAKALGDTMPGQINKLKQSFNNLAGEIVGGLAPAFATGLEKINGFIAQVSQAHGFTAKIRVAASLIWEGLESAVGTLRDKLSKLLFGGMETFKFGADETGHRFSKGLVQNIQEAFQSADWSAIGQSIVDGISEALKSAATLAKQIGSVITEAIRNVPWEQVGRVLGPGLASAVTVAFVTLLDPAFWIKNWDLALAVMLVAFGGGIGRVAGKLGGVLLKALSRPMADAMLGLGALIARVSPRLAELFIHGVSRIPALLEPVFANAGRLLSAAFARIEALVRSLFGRLGGLAVLTLKVLGIDIAINALTQFATGPVWGTIQGAFNAVVAAGQAAWSAVASAVTTAISAVQATLTTAWSAITAGATAAWNAIKAVITAVLGGIQAVVQAYVNTYTTIFTTAWNTIRTVATAAWNAIRTVITAVLTAIGAVLRTYVTTWTTVLTTAWNTIRTVATAAWNAIRTAITTVLTTITTAIRTAGQQMLTAITGPWNAIKALAVTVFNAVVATVRNSASQAIAAAVAVGQGILKGVSDGLTGLVKMVQGWFQSLWAWIAGAANSAYAFALNIGKQMAQGVADGITSLAGKVWDAATGLVSGAVNKLKVWKSPPDAFGYWLGSQVGVGLAKGLASSRGPVDAAATATVRAAAMSMSRNAVTLGAGLIRAISTGMKSAAGNLTATAKALGITLQKAGTDATKLLGASAIKGMGDASGLIVAAARKVGVDARAALAVAMSEGGTALHGPAGDQGTSFGPFQLHIGGANPYGDPAKARAFAESIQGITYALEQMAKAGAAGKTGYDAIATIVREFERPANPAAEIQRAMAYYAKIPEVIGTAIKTGAPKVAQGVQAIYGAIAGVIRQYAPQVGLQQARDTIAGMIQAHPGVLALSRQQMVEVMQKKLEAISAAKTQLASAFGSLAQGALEAFDAKVQAWVPPAQRILDAFQLQDEIKTLTESLGASVTSAEANVIEQMRNGTAAQLAEARRMLSAGIAQARAEMMAQSQAPVDAAMTALNAALAGGDPEAIATAQAALTQAQTDQQNAIDTFNTTVRGIQERNLTELAARQQRYHDETAATQRTALTNQLIELQKNLLEHPKSWDRAQAEVIRVLGTYGVKFKTSGNALGTQFANGIEAAIPEVRAAAAALAAAASNNLPQSPAKEGPLAFDLVKAAKRWAEGFGKGVRQARPLFANGGTLELAGGNVPVASGGVTVNVTVQGALLGSTVPQVADTIYRELVRKNGRNVSLGLTR